MADCFIVRRGGNERIEFDEYGIDGIFDMDTLDVENNVWRNKIENGNSINLAGTFAATQDMGHNVLQITGNGYGEYASKMQPTGYYVVARAVTAGSSWSAFIGKKMSASGAKYDYGSFFHTEINPQSLGCSCASEFATSKVTAPCDKYHVICRYNGGAIIDGQVIANPPQVIDAPTGVYTNYYDGYMELHRLYRSSFTSGAWTANYLFVAFCNIEHSQKQAIKNSEFLMKKYNIT